MWTLVEITWASYNSAFVFPQPLLPPVGSRHLRWVEAAAPLEVRRVAVEGEGQVDYACPSWAADTVSLTAKRIWMQVQTLRLSPGRVQHRQTQKQSRWAAVKCWAALARWFWWTVTATGWAQAAALRAAWNPTTCCCSTGTTRVLTPSTTSMQYRWVTVMQSYRIQP